MRRLTAFVLVAGVLSPSGLLVAQGRIKRHGRAIVEYRAPDVTAVAAYEYSQRNHTGAWLLIEIAVQTKNRIAFTRGQLSLIMPDERRVALATQQAYLADHAVLSNLFQNAAILRRPLSSYFNTKLAPTVRFFSSPGGIVHDSVATNLDEVATGDLLFKSPDAAWAAGTYRVVLNHEKAKAELPIELR